MAEDTDQQQTQQQSIIASALAVQSTLMAYLKVRLQLLGRESKFAAINLGLVIGFAMFTAMLLFFCWPILMVTVGFWIFELGGGYWATDNQSALIWPVFLAIFLLHIFFALILIILAKWRLKKVSLKRTLDEINKDREWLNSLKEKL